MLGDEFFHLFFDAVDVATEETRTAALASSGGARPPYTPPLRGELEEAWVAAMNMFGGTV